MADVLKEHFRAVAASDVADYGYGQIRDYLAGPLRAHDWVITNPPYVLAEEFAMRALKSTRVGCALLTRTVFVEGAGRYERLLRDDPPTLVAQFVRRVAFVRGELSRRGPSGVSYAWLVWERRKKGSSTTMTWIPPECREELERDGDYDSRVPA